MQLCYRWCIVIGNLLSNVLDFWVGSKIVSSHIMLSIILGNIEDGKEVAEKFDKKEIH
jgi:hypothetical protein